MFLVERFCEFKAQYLHIRLNLLMYFDIIWNIFIFTADVLGSIFCFEDLF